MSEQEQQIPSEKKARFNWTRWLNYQSIVKQMPFFLFMAVLGCYLYL
jgi:hypothetical protein